MFYNSDGNLWSRYQEWHAMIFRVKHQNSSTSNNNYSLKYIPFSNDFWRLWRPCKNEVSNHTASRISRRSTRGSCSHPASGASEKLHKNGMCLWMVSEFWRSCGRAHTPWGKAHGSLFELQFKPRALFQAQPHTAECHCSEYLSGGADLDTLNSLGEDDMPAEAR